MDIVQLWLLHPAKLIILCLSLLSNFLACQECVANNNKIRDIQMNLQWNVRAQVNFLLGTRFVTHFCKSKNAIRNCVINFLNCVMKMKKLGQKQKYCEQLATTPHSLPRTSRTSFKLKHVDSEEECVKFEVC